MGKPIIKSAEEIALMRKAGAIAAGVLRDAKAVVVPGLSTAELDQMIGQFIRQRGAVSAFLKYRGFPSNSCLSVNNAVIHGIGDARKLQFGDLVKIDVGVRFEGMVGDVAMTVACGGCSPEDQKLMDVAVRSLYDGISFARSGGTVNDIGRAVQKCVESNGFGVVREFCGHGVGRAVHEEPQVPNYVDPVHGRTRLKAGMTLAIEPMVTAGSPAVKILEDRWTVVTRDGRNAAHFEHTVLITEGEPEVLTRDDGRPLY